MSNHISISKITINAPASRVWEAVTKPELVKQWQYGANLITDWQTGSPIVYRNEWEGTIYEQKGTVLEVVPEKLVKYQPVDRLYSDRDKLSCKFLKFL